MIKISKYKEYKVGEIFKYNGNKLISKKAYVNKCENCFFDLGDDCLCPDYIVCDASLREDETSTYFRELSEIEYLILKGSD